MRRLPHYLSLRSYLIGLLLIMLIGSLHSFSPNRAIRSTHSSRLFLAKQRLSMKEKRARRRERAKPLPELDRPPCTLDFKTPPPKPSEKFTKKAPTSTTQGLDPSKKITDPGVAENRAKQLIDAQRASVDMLTLVKNRIEQIPLDEASKALESHAYFVMDNFLGDTGAMESLLAERVKMLDSMDADLSNLGSGEYVASIKGGDEQYKICPRSIEFVVSCTKHLGAHLKDDTLDASACMATLRTFDEKAFKASAKLLTGDQDIDMGASNQKFGFIADEEDDQRKLTMIYYLVDEDWKDEYGGGIEVESEKRMIPAKRDRLILLQSDNCSVRSIPWKGAGNDQDSLGSAIELHLVAKREKSL